MKFYLLLEHGASSILTDKDGVTPSEHARRRDLTLITPLLEEAESPLLKKRG
jgi:hypothetical protein